MGKRPSQTAVAFIGFISGLSEFGGGDPAVKPFLGTPAPVFGFGQRFELVIFPTEASSKKLIGIPSGGSEDSADVVGGCTVRLLEFRREGVPRGIGVMGVNGSSHEIAMVVEEIF